MKNRDFKMFELMDTQMQLGGSQREATRLRRELQKAEQFIKDKGLWEQFTTGITDDDNEGNWLDKWIEEELPDEAADMGTHQSFDNSKP